MKMAAFWVVALCSLADIDGRFRVAYCITLMTEDSHLQYYFRDEFSV
jgi:hypothetical protein